MNIDGTSTNGSRFSPVAARIGSSSAEKNGPRFSFVMIVLNGMPFIEYSLKSVYDFAHEIIIIEGAVENCMFAANADGSSTDGTVEFIESFPDPQNKVKLVRGRWPEKCEMQNEALRYVTGDYVWLIDSDEVYKREDLEKIKEILKGDPSITQVNFIQDSFWKGLDYIFVSSKFFEDSYHSRRIFKYVPGSVFTTHRPPTLVWPGSNRTTEQINLLDGTAVRAMGITFYHYSYVLDEQVKQKIQLYDRYGWGRQWNLDLGRWYEECFRKWTPENRQQIDSDYPIWTGDANSRTQLFTSTHPEVMRGFADRHSCSEAVKDHTGSVVAENAIVQAKSTIADPMERLRRRPQYLKIETTNICNANCAFCAYRFMQRKKGAMSMDLLKKVIDDYVAVGGGALTMSPLVGDCLVDTKFLERLRYCRSFNEITHIGFHTNHIGLSRWTDEQVLEIFDLVDVWNCSIGPNRDVYRDMFGVDKFEQVVANLERLQRLMSVSEHKPLIQLNGRAAAGALEEDERLTRLSSILAGRRINWNTTYSDWGGILPDLPRNTPIERAGGPGEKRLVCMKSLISSVVFCDGRVGFCGCADFDALLTIGDANKEKLGDILAGEKRLKMLGSFGKPWLNEYCRKCSFYEPMNIEWMAKWIEGTNPHHPEPIRPSLERGRRKYLVGSCTERHRQSVERSESAAVLSNTPPAEVHVENVLWVRTDSIGDNVLAASTLPHIRQKYEGARITVVCQEHIAELYEACPNVDDIVVFNRIRALQDERYREEIVMRLRALKPDVSLNSVYSREALTDWFAIKCGAEQRIAFNGDLCNISAELRDMHNQFYTDLLPSPGTHKLEFERSEDFLRGLGIEAADLQPMIWTTAEDEAFAEKFFQDNGLSAGNTIALFPSAQHSWKVYEQYKSVLQDFDGFRFVILGGKDAEGYAGEICSGLPQRCWNLAGRTTIRQMAAIIRRCCLYLGSDSAGAHIACAVGIPNVVVLGGGHFGRFMPYSPLTSVVCLPLECYGCNWGCRYENPHCVKDVAVEVVAEALRQSLAKSSHKIRVFMQGNSLWKPSAGQPAWKTFERFVGMDSIEVIPIEAHSNTISGSGGNLDVHTPGPERLADAECRPDVERPGDAGLTIATSIAPKKLKKQAKAIESWAKLGFDVVSLNCREEIDILQESFPDVKFVQAKRDARNTFGKPVIYLDDFFEYFCQADSEFCGIVNSDIFLIGDEGVIPFIQSQARNALVYGSRIEIDSLEVLWGEVFEDGFDFFFFHKSLISCFPKSDFCIGIPWWDYWVPLISALEKVQIKKFITPFAYHIKHSFNWDMEQWIYLAQKCLKYLLRRIDENFNENPDNNPWAFLGNIFSTYHNQDVGGCGTKYKMSPDVFCRCLLDFLEKKTLQITYADNKSTDSRNVSALAKKKEDIFIHKGDSRTQKSDCLSAEYDVGIIICTNGRAELLDQMLTSLKEAARGVVYELIVVEGGSRDNTLDVLRKHNVKKVYSESEWLGPDRHSWPQLYNFGFSMTNVKWAMYASDDIVFAKGCVSKAVRLLNKQRDEVAGGIFFYKNTYQTRPEWDKLGIDFTYGPRLLMNYGLVRLDHFREVGGLDEAYRFYCADSDLCCKLYEKGKQLIPLPESFVVHNNVLDAQKRANADTSGCDIQLFQERWKHLIPTEIPRSRRLFWQEEFFEAFNLPADLERIDSGIESFWYGLACFQEGFFEEAKSRFMQVVKSFCDHDQVLWYLARAADKCGDKAMAEKAATAVVKLAPDFEPALELLLRVTGPRQYSPAPVLCSVGSGAVNTVNSYADEPGPVKFHLDGQGWGRGESANQASSIATMARAPRRSGPDRCEMELRREIGRFNKVVVWGLKTSSHTHAHIHRHFFDALTKVGAKAAFVDDSAENVDVLERNDLIIAVDVASSHLPIAEGVYYCLHNCPDDIHRRIAPARNIRLQTYTNLAEPASGGAEKWDEVTFFDSARRTLFQPWATDLLASEFEEPILHRSGGIVFWVGSIWDDGLGRGNVNEIQTLKDVLEARDIRFVHLRSISDSLNVRYVRSSLIAPAIVGRWQMEHNYLPCRMWKNISYGQLGVSNVRKFDEVFDDCTVKGRSIEEIIDNTLSLPFSTYRDMICRQQEIVKSRHTYVNRLLNIIRAFESIENRSRAFV